MKEAKRSARKETLLQPPRPPKAGHPPVKKDTMILEVAEGSRVLWGVTKPKVKKG